jgi:EAL domain-containing protein (putative c-di-GMP-specific phosphodiesterase class I)
VNMSIRQFQRRDIFDTVSGIIKETAMDPAYLQVELTESVFMTNTQSSGELLNGLEMLGVQLAIDDFGTGCELNDAAIVQAATERLRRGSDTIPTLSSAE